MRTEVNHFTAIYGRLRLRYSLNLRSVSQGAEMLGLLNLGGSSFDVFNSQVLCCCWVGPLVAYHLLLSYQQIAAVAEAQ